MIHLSFDSEHKPHAKVVPHFKCCGNGSYFTEAEVKDLLEESYLTEEVRVELTRALNDDIPAKPVDHANVVPPARLNLWERPVYVPEPWGR